MEFILRNVLNEFRHKLNLWHIFWIMKHVWYYIYCDEYYILNHFVCLFYDTIWKVMNEKNFHTFAASCWYESFWQTGIEPRVQPSECCRITKLNRFFCCILQITKIRWYAEGLLDYIGWKIKIKPEWTGE